MNKKGQYALHELLLTLGEVSIAGLVLITFLFYIREIEDNSFLEKNYKARDISLIIETLESSPGGIFYYYNDDRGFIYRFASNKIDVYSQNERLDQPAITYYFFPENKNLQYIYPEDLLIPDPFEKNTGFGLQKGYDFRIADDIDEGIDFMSCPEVDVETGSIILKFEQEEDKEISGALSRFMPTVVISEESTKKVLEDKSAAFIYLKYSDKDFVSIYISRNIASRAFACSISNELRKKGIRSLIVPEDFEKTRAYLVIEFNKNMKGDIANAIYNALSR